MLPCVVGSGPLLGLDLHQGSSRIFPLPALPPFLTSKDTLLSDSYGPHPLLPCLPTHPFSPKPVGPLLLLGPLVSSFLLLSVGPP